MPNYNEVCENEEGKRKNCQALKDSILATCASLSGVKRARCVFAAEDAYDQCMSGL